MKLEMILNIGFMTLLALLITFQPAVAEIHLGRDVLGLSTEADDSGLFELEDLPAGPLKLELLVYGYDHAQGISAWNCAVVVPPNVLVMRTTLMGGGTNSRSQAGNFMVTTLDPLLPVNGIIHLATMDLQTLDSDSKDFFIIGDPMSADPESMGYAQETSSSMRLPFNWPESCDDCPVFRIINVAQPTFHPQWDQVKALYR